MRLLVLLAMLLFAAPALAHERPPPADTSRIVRPPFCRHYDMRDYRYERRLCLDDRRCHWRMRQKARRCGLIP